MFRIVVVIYGYSVITKIPQIQNFRQFFYNMSNILLKDKIIHKFIKSFIFWKLTEWYFCFN
jgi:hypothetical protein